jgi:lambda family phage portal protein
MPTLLDRIANRLGYASQDRVKNALIAHAQASRLQKRTFEAGQVSRLTADFVPSQISIDTDLINRLRLMRMRSRFLFKNEPYAKRFARLIQKNIVGPAGVQLVVHGNDDPEHDSPLSPEAAKEIQKRWNAWACSPWVTTDRRSSWRQVQRLAATTTVTDGEAFVRIVISAANPYLVSLRFVVADQFDEQYNANGPTSQIRMAAETDADSGERIAYWPWPTDPSDAYAFTRKSGPRRRVPAGEVVHWFLPDFVGQTRGIPWLFATIPQLNMLNGYADAELVASRVSASKMGFFVMPEGQGYAGDGEDAAGNTVTEASPGTFEELPFGSELKQFDPQHPNANFANFQKAMLRGTAAGGDVSYHTLSGDLESVNYSSARIGLLDERDGYAMVQDEFVAGFCQPVFRAWLVAQASLGAIPLTAEAARTFDAVTWRPRRWSWVDPQKEINAAISAVGLRIKSRTQIIAETGESTFEATAAELAAEEELLDELDLLPALPGQPSPPTEAAEAGEAGQDSTEKKGSEPRKNGRLSFHVSGKG